MESFPTAYGFLSPPTPLICTQLVANFSKQHKSNTKGCSNDLSDDILSDIICTCFNGIKIFQLEYPRILFDLHRIAREMEEAGLSRWSWAEVTLVRLLQLCC